MLDCDIYVAILSTNENKEFIRSDGTFIEIGWAYALNKPIVLIVDEDVMEKTSDLLKCMIDEKRILVIKKDQLLHNDLSFMKEDIYETEFTI